MEKFATIISTAVPLPVDNVDTDQIIPARFLKAVDRSGFGENLFRDWRFDESGKPKRDFILNNPAYSGKILVTGENFGSGSSREHAAWALFDYGFRVIIAHSFADIFRNNALNNGLLVIEVPSPFLSELKECVLSDPQTLIQVDLTNQTVTNMKTGNLASFEISSNKKNCLEKGYDDIDYLFSIIGKIVSFEKSGRML
jgi:3-isopropylmalate/(R)-2-methylmalate dehydratase small subunit